MSAFQVRRVSLRSRIHCSRNGVKPSLQIDRNIRIGIRPTRIVHGVRGTIGKRNLAHRHPNRRILTRNINFMRTRKRCSCHSGLLPTPALPGSGITVGGSPSALSASHPRGAPVLPRPILPKHKNSTLLRVGSRPDAKPRSGYPRSDRAENVLGLLRKHLAAHRCKHRQPPRAFLYLCYFKY